MTYGRQMFYKRNIDIPRLELNLIDFNLSQFKKLIRIDTDYNLLVLEFKLCIIAASILFFFFGSTCYVLILTIYLTSLPYSEKAYIALIVTCSKL